jgi:protein-disulfide isomerase
VQEALLGYEDDVAFVFRHFPLVSIHPNAMIAHRAAEAAGEQGKFFDMHDLLYERQQLWSTGDSADDIISVFAEELELNMDQYRETFNSSETLQKINTQLDAGQSIGVSATPTFFVNGEQLEQSPRSVEELRAIIEQALSN